MLVQLNELSRMQIDKDLLSPTMICLAISVEMTFLSLFPFLSLTFTCFLFLSLSLFPLSLSSSLSTFVFPLLYFSSQFVLLVVVNLKSWEIVRIHTHTHTQADTVRVMS